MDIIAGVTVVVSLACAGWVGRRVERVADGGFAGMAGAVVALLVWVFVMEAIPQRVRTVTCAGEPSWSTCWQR